MHAHAFHSIERGLFVCQYGPAGLAPALLWLHGLGASGLSFEKIVAHPQLLAFRHLVPDLPGYGRSPWPSEPLSLDSHACLIADWLAEKGEAPVIVVGHSMGGTLGQILSERHGERVAAFANVEGNIGLDDCTSSAPVAAMTVERFSAVGFDALRDAVYREGGRDEALKAYYVGLRLCDPRAFHLNARELVELSRQGDLAGRLAALPQRSVYIAGRPGGASPGSLAALSEAAVQTVVIEPSGHCPFVDQPDLFAGALREFVVGVSRWASP